MKKERLYEVIDNIANTLELEAENCKTNSHYHGHTHYQRSDTLREIAEAFRLISSELR